MSYQKLANNTITLNQPLLKERQVQEQNQESCLKKLLKQQQQYNNKNKRQKIEQQHQIEKQNKKDDENHILNHFNKGLKNLNFFTQSFLTEQQQIQKQFAIKQYSQSPHQDKELKRQEQSNNLKKIKKRVPQFLKRSFNLQRQRKTYSLQQYDRYFEQQIQKRLQDYQNPILNQNFIYQRNQKKRSQQQKEQIRQKMRMVFQIDDPYQSFLQRVSNIMTQKYFCVLCEEDKFQPLSSICNCQHYFCDECLDGYLSYKISNMSIQIHCPQENCDSKFDQNCEFFQRMPNKIKKKYNRNKVWRATLKQDNVRLCPRQYCDDGLIDLTQIPPRCQKCGKTFCKQCQLQAHQGPCQQNFQEFNKAKDWKRCPQCKMFIQKNEGCNHITCNCTHQFCYQCLCKWNDTHYGCGNPQYQELLQRIEQLGRIRGQIRANNFHRNMNLNQQTIRRNFAQPIFAPFDSKCYKILITLLLPIHLVFLMTLLIISFVLGIVIGWIFLTLTLIPCSIYRRRCASRSDIQFILSFPLRSMSQIYKFYVRIIIRCNKRAQYPQLRFAAMQDLLHQFQEAPLHQPIPQPLPGFRQQHEQQFRDFSF